MNFFSHAATFTLQILIDSDQDYVYGSRPSRSTFKGFGCFNELVVYVEEFF